MIKIRHSMFETNSSACHSVVFKTRDPNIEMRDYRYLLKTWDGDNIKLDDCGYILVHLKNYGWGPVILKDLEEKLSYLASQCIGHTDNNIDINQCGCCSTGDEYEPMICISSIPSEDTVSPKDWRAWNEDEKRLQNNPEWQEIEETVKRHIPDCLGIRVVPSSGYTEDGIALRSAVDCDGYTLEQLLFSPDILILVDNDNH